MTVGWHERRGRGDGNDPLQPLGAVLSHKPCNIGMVIFPRLA